jgi:CBS domain-containing protein
MIIGTILREKGAKVVTVRPDVTLLEAIRTLVKSHIGSLLVTDENDKILGIITERDILRYCVDGHTRLTETPVAEVMTRDVIVGVPDDTVESVMSLMTEKRFRHLPVMSKGKLAGIISIVDVVRAKARHQEFEIRHLTDYITGKYPG